MVMTGDSAVGDSAVEIDIENKYVKVYTKNGRQRDIILSKLRLGLRNTIQTREE
jgi:hypothetical protein